MMIAGLSLLVYPLVANTWNNHVQSRLVNNYSETVTSAIEEGKLDVDAELSKAVQYNVELLPSILTDSLRKAL